MPPKTFKCPICKKIQKAIASEVMHRCPSNHNKMTTWEIVQDDKL